MISITAIIIAATLWNRKRVLKKLDTDNNTFSENFALSEFVKTSTGVENIPGPEEIANLKALVDNILQPLRTAIGKPIKVTSGYRSELVNRMIGGAGNSQHVSGQAADIQVDGMTNQEIIDKVRELGLRYDQVIDEVKGNSSWVHITFNKNGGRGNWLTYRNGVYETVARNYA